MQAAMLISLVVLATALTVVIRAARMRMLAVALCIAAVAFLALVAGMAERTPWLSVLGFLGLIAAFPVFIGGLVTHGRPRPAPALPPPWGPPAKEDTPGWRPESAPPWQPRDPKG
jgi:hypothetical protein